MAFSKSRVCRFSEKSETKQLLQGTSSYDISIRPQSVAATTGDERKSLVSQSFIESSTIPRSSSAKYGSAISKIGKPLSRPCTRSGCNDVIRRSTADGIDEQEVTKCDSSTTFESGAAEKSATYKSTTGSKIPSSFQNTPKTGDFHKRNFEYQYNLKLKRFNTLKKELLEKQKPAIDLFRTLTSLRKKITDHEGKLLPVEELKIVEYQETSQADNKEIKAIQENIKQLKAKLQATPLVFIELCRQILDEKCKVIENIFDDDGEWNQDDLMRKLLIYKQDTATLEGNIVKKMQEEECKMRDLIKEWHTLARLHPDYDEDSRNEVDIKLQETEHKLKQVMAELHFEKNKKLKENEKIRELERDITKLKEKFIEANKTLEDERNRNMGIKARFEVYEQKMKTAKGRMKQAETLKQEYELKYEALQEKFRQAEEDWQTKEEFLETQNKDLQHYVKTQTDNVLQMESEKRSVNARLLINLFFNIINQIIYPNLLL